ncbi:MULTISPECIES: AAA family ATPase [Enterobacter]|uniref:AAA family ATPase n=1 Tax=Enterobacter TaxID=547 RepID=UPI000A38D528|nr:MULTISPECIES: AAA family ATPase [Enterobacter]ELW9536657.1 AAA family ATPase [Enterobacter roggenkampii]NIG46388.1 ATP-binding protein [Enterobacter sp. Acro-832]
MKISLSNVGSIKGSSIEIGDLTVIAGENDTGKSTFGKVLYAIIKSYNTYYIERNRLNNRILMSNFKEIVEATRYLSINLEQHHLNKVHSALLNLQQSIVFNKDIDLEIKNLHDIIDLPMKGGQEIFQSEKMNEEKNTLKDVVYKFYHNYTRTRNSDFDEDRYCKSSHDILRSEFVNKIVSNKEQTASITIDFISSSERKSSFQMSFNDIKVEKHNLVGVDNFNFKDVTFIDSPAILQYYQLMSAFPNDKLSSMNIPHHTIDVLSKLKTSKIKSDSGYNLKIIDSYDGGMIINDDLTQFFFRKNNELIPSNNVASGVKAISIIEMLFEGGNINDKSIIIIDEPETNLHPKWQIEYAKCICNLVNKGCKFLITTHSPYMIEAFKVYSSESKRVKFYYSNKNDGNVKYKDCHGDIHEILECLSKPFDQIMLDSGNYDY